MAQDLRCRVLLSGLRLVTLTVTLLLSACYGLGGGIAGPRSEIPVDESQVATLPTGLSKDELFQRLGPPAEESGYPNLQETVASWRIIEPGNRRMMFNAHFDPSGRVKTYSRTPDWTAVGSESRR